MTEEEINELHQKRILKNETVHKILDTVLDKIPLAQGTVPNSYLLGTCQTGDPWSASLLVGPNRPVLVRRSLVQTILGRCSNFGTKKAALMETLEEKVPSKVGQIEAHKFYTDNLLKIAG